MQADRQWLILDQGDDRVDAQQAAHKVISIAPLGDGQSRRQINFRQDGERDEKLPLFFPQGSDDLFGEIIKNPGALLAAIGPWGLRLAAIEKIKPRQLQHHRPALALLDKGLQDAAVRQPGDQRAGLVIAELQGLGIDQARLIFYQQF